MSAPQLPDRLRRELAADHRAVRPLRAPAVRTLLLALWALALALAVPALFGLRADAPELGFLLTWGAAAGEVLGGLLLVGLALRESIPGAAVSRGMMIAALAGGFAVEGAVTLLTLLGAPDRAVAGVACGRTCMAIESGLALPALALTAVLVARALPLRPAWTGALAGLGAALLADGAWHLGCAACEPRHLLIWHGGATVAMTAIGWGLGLAWQRWRVRRLER